MTPRFRAKRGRRGRRHGEGQLGGSEGTIVIEQFAQSVARDIVTWVTTIKKLELRAG